MTTNSFATSMRTVVGMLAEKRPDISVAKYKLVRVGTQRLAQITLATGEYMQFVAKPLGTHQANFTQHLYDEIDKMRKPRRCQVPICTRKDDKECAHVDCGNRRRLTAAPPGVPDYFPCEGEKTPKRRPHGSAE